MFSTAAQFIALVASAYALYKAVIEFAHTKKPRLRDDYEFAKKLLNEIDSTTHPLILEKGYTALTGDKELRAVEIRYFLAAPAPSSSLRKYSYARSILRFTPGSNGTEDCISFAPEFTDERKRDSYKNRKLVLYWIFAMIAFSPLIFFRLISESGLANSLAIIITSLFAFGSIATESLLDYARVLRAEELVKEHSSEL